MVEIVVKLRRGVVMVKEMVMEMVTMKELLAGPSLQHLLTQVAVRVVG